MSDASSGALELRYPACELENDVLKLSPYEPSLHGQAFFDGLAGHPELFKYMPMAPFASVDLLNEWVDAIRQDPSRVLFAMIDKTGVRGCSCKCDPGDAGTVAGIVGLLNTPENLATEIGLLFTLPAFQRTHVTRTAVALLLRFAFEDLRLRRVQWRALAENTASVRAAERMGFQREGINRWARVVPPGVPGNIARKKDPMPNCRGLHVLCLAICWDDWEGGWDGRVKDMLEDFREKVAPCVHVSDTEVHRAAFRISTEV